MHHRGASLCPHTAPTRAGAPTGDDPITEAHQGTADAPGRGTVNDRPTDPRQAPALTRSADGRCARITLRRPAHRNRLHAEDLLALRAHFRAIDADPAIRVVVLDAQVQGPRPVFCAGYHLGEHGGEHPDATFEQVADALEHLRPVTVCALAGSVYGGATDLVLACDFAIGVTGLQARMPAAALGLHYYPGGLSRFVSRLGLVQAKRAFLAA